MRERGPRSPANSGTLSDSPWGYTPVCRAQATIRSRFPGVPGPGVRRAGRRRDGCAGGRGFPGAGPGRQTGPNSGPRRAFPARAAGFPGGAARANVGPFPGRTAGLQARAGSGRRRAVWRAGCARAGARGVERGGGRRRRVCPGAVPWRRGGRKAPVSCPACEGFFPHTLPGPPVFSSGAEGFFRGGAGFCGRAARPGRRGGAFFFLYGAYGAFPRASCVLFVT